MSMIDVRGNDDPAGIDAGRSPSSLRQQLIGTWRLVSCVARDIDSGEESRPMGKHPLGLIIYTPDGFMSAQLSTAHRSPFQGNDPQNGTPDEYTEAARGYLAYSGPFHVDERNQLVTHEMQVSLFPNWLGQRQLRLVERDGDLLRLATVTPMTFHGARMTATLVWKRVQPNV